MAVKRESSTTIHLTRRTYDALRRRARDAGKDPDSLAEEIVKQAVSQPKPEPAETEREQVRRVLREAGMLVDPSAYQDMIQPGLDFDAIREEMRARRLVPSLSELIISERHEE